MLQAAFNIGQPTDLIDRIIRFLTKGEYYHCELIFSNGDAYSADPKSGTRYTTIDYKDTTKWILLPLFWITEQQEKLIRAFCDDECGCKYDWTAVLFGWLFTPVESDTNWYCCEVMHSAIRPFLKTVKDKWYSPIQLFRALQSEITWQKRLMSGC